MYMRTIKEYIKKKNTNDNIKINQIFTDILHTHILLPLFHI